MEDPLHCHTDNGIHMMAGLPNWMFFTGIGLVLLVSFFIYFLKSGKTFNKRYDISRKRFIAYLLKRRWLQFFAQLPLLFLFAMILYAGFFGNPRINIAPTLTWTIWWGGLIFAILFLGKIWCFVCPWDLVASVASRLRLWKTNHNHLSLNLKWPYKARNISLAIGLFIILTWLELGFKVTTAPFATAMMGLFMLMLVVLAAFIFEKKSFCRYGCLVGRISGLYANLSPVEIRARDRRICMECKTKDCFKGNGEAYPCPTGLNLTTLDENTYCTMCTECFKACPSDNVALNIRPFGADIISYPRPKTDEALLAVVLLSLTSFHGLSMTPLWEDLTGNSNSIIAFMNGFFGLGPLFSFTVGMALVLVVPYLLYHFLCGVSARVSNNGITTWEIFIRFSYSLIPIALFYHLAHNTMHLGMEGQSIIPLLSDPFGYGWDLFGTVGKSYPMLLSDNTVWAMQVILVITGHILGIKIAARAGEKMFGTGRRALLAQVPLLTAMIVFSFTSLSIMHLDMNMRSSMM